MILCRMEGAINNSFFGKVGYMYKKYLLRCSELTGDDSYDSECWESRKYYFDTKEEMVEFVKKQLDFLFKVETAFKLDKLDNDIFA